MCVNLKGKYMNETNKFFDVNRNEMTDVVVTITSATGVIPATIHMTLVEARQLISCIRDEGVSFELERKSGFLCLNTANILSAEVRNASV